MKHLIHSSWEYYATYLINNFKSSFLQKTFGIENSYLYFIYRAFHKMYFYANVNVIRAIQSIIDFDSKFYPIFFSEYFTKEAQNTVELLK